MVISVASTNFSYAKDLGVQGKIFEINELDIRIQMMIELAKNMTSEKFQEEAERVSDEFYSELPRHNLIISRSHKVDYIDPTRVYEDDFWSFKESNNGDYEWYKISEAGTSVNWLEHHNAPMQKFFIFDPLDNRQLEIARQLYSLKNPYLTIVMVGGDIVKVSESVGGPITYLNDDIIREYDLQFTPVVVRRGEGSQINKYKKIRYNTDDVKFEDVLSEIEGFSKWH